MEDTKNLLDIVKDQHDFLDNDFDNQIMFVIKQALKDLKVATGWDLYGSILDSNLNILIENDITYIIIEYCSLKVGLWLDRYNKTIIPFYRESLNDILLEIRILSQNYETINDYLGDKNAK